MLVPANALSRSQPSPRDPEWRWPTGTALDFRPRIAENERVVERASARINAAQRAGETR
jgi:hypothetical protein